MDFGLASGELVLLALVLVAGGVIAGFLAGLLGIGGGGVLVPVLYEIFSLIDVPETIRMQMVLGTSFAIIVPTALQSFRGHLARGSVDVSIIRRLGPWVFAGVVSGIALVSIVSGHALKWVWIVCALAIACKMALGREDWRLADDVPKSPLVSLAAFSIGLLSTLMSIGGGMFMVSLLTLCGWPILKAVATSSGFGPIIAVPGLLGYIWAGWGAADLPPLSLGYVSMIGAALVVPASVLSAPLGVRAAHGISRRKLEIAFAVFLAAVALRLLASMEW